jgi:hypothetical protein
VRVCVCVCVYVCSCVKTGAGDMSLGGHAGGQLVCGNCTCGRFVHGAESLITIALPLLDKIMDGKQLVHASVRQLQWLNSTPVSFDCP